jgi:hypothetical protein
MPLSPCTDSGMRKTQCLLSHLYVTLTRKLDSTDNPHHNSKRLNPLVDSLLARSNLSTDQHNNPEFSPVISATSKQRQLIGNDPQPLYSRVRTR